MLEYEKWLVYGYEEVEIFRFLLNPVLREQSSGTELVLSIQDDPDTLP